jgi:hypothetical protein
MCWHWFAPKENYNDTNCFCDGGRGVVIDGRFRDFAGGADCAGGGCFFRSKRLCDEGMVASSLLAWAVGPPALLVSNRVPFDTVACAAPNIRRGVFFEIIAPAIAGRA